MAGLFKLTAGSPDFETETTPVPLSMIAELIISTAGELALNGGALTTRKSSPDVLSAPPAVMLPLPTAEPNFRTLVVVVALRIPPSGPKRKMLESEAPLMTAYGFELVVRIVLTSVVVPPPPKVRVPIKLEL